MYRSNRFYLWARLSCRSVIFASVLLVCWQTAAFAETDREAAWICVGDRFPYGTTRITVSRTGIRGESPVSAFIITAAQPQLMKVVSEENRLFLPVRVGYWFQQSMQAGAQYKPLEIERARRVGVGKLDQLAFTRYEGLDRHGVVVAQFETCDLKLPAALESSWCRLMGAPARYGFPFKLWQVINGRLVLNFGLHR